MNRGENFEKARPKSEYFNEAYFDIRQLMAQTMQIKLIHEMKPESIIEIGIGNGLTSSFFKNSGLEIVTADINSNLNPDICCSIYDLPNKLNDRKFDLVVCCEVLEHMPVDELDRNIAILKSIGRRLFLTLPGYTRSFGLSGLIKFPWIQAKDFFLYFFMRKNIDLSMTQHFWEVGSETKTERNIIIEKLKNNYSKVRTGRISFQPNHIFFIAE